MPTIIIENKDVDKLYRKYRRLYASKNLGLDYSKSKDKFKHCLKTRNLVGFTERLTTTRARYVFVLKNEKR